MSKEKKQKKPKSKARNIIEWTGTIIVGILFLFVAACNISKIATKNEYGQGTAFGYSTFVVQTESMEPVYPVGTAIITYKYEPDEIYKEWKKIESNPPAYTSDRAINLTFFDAASTSIGGNIPGMTRENPIHEIMTHQLFKMDVRANVAVGKGKYLFYVHGINTESVRWDPSKYQVFTEKELLGQVKMKSSFVGTVAKLITSAWGLLICLLIPALYLIICSVIDIFKAYNTDEETENGVKIEGAGESKDSSGKSNAIDNLSDEDYERLKQQLIDEMLEGKDKK